MDNAQNSSTLPRKPVGGIDRRWLERCATDGVVAAIETAAGERLRIGRSDRFGCEQALRLERFTFASGAAPGDRPTATLVLASEDTDRAQTDTDDYEED